MQTFLLFVVPAVCLCLTLAILRSYYVRDKLTARLFAITFASGWSLTLLAYFFLGLALRQVLLANVKLIGLGVGIAVLNFLLGYPIAYYMYKFLLHRFLKPPGASKNT